MFCLQNLTVPHWDPLKISPVCQPFLSLNMIISSHKSNKSPLEMKQDKKSKPATTGGSAGATPCAACKLLRRRCSKDECTFAPYFPADDPVKFATVHKVFGASNVNKMLQDLPVQHRGDAVSSIVYEANARIRDPVYGCVGAISALQQQINVLQAQLALAQAEVLHLRSSQSQPAPCKTVNSTTAPNGKVFTDTSSCTTKSLLATDCAWW